MDASKLIGYSVEHISYGTGIIISVNDGRIQVQFASGETKKYQYPQAFTAYLKLSNESLMSEILKDAEVQKQKEDAEKAKLRAKRESELRIMTVPSKTMERMHAVNRPAPKSKEEPGSYDGRIIDRNTAFFTHAEMLNTCFGYHYKHFQKAYKGLDNGYAVWFPRIAKKVGSQYLSSDSYWGWLNIISENGDTITQLDNPDFPYSGGGPDKNKRIIFARFEGDDRYRFIGVYVFEKRLSNGESFTRIGTKFDTKTMKIIE